MARMLSLSQDKLNDFDDCSFSSDEYENHDQDDLLHLNIIRTTINDDDSSLGDIETSATFRHIHQCKIENINYSISDGGADSCVLGKTHVSLIKLVVMLDLLVR